jgi:2-polyprenyl-3-methyl-5-hydroxy-6-metoxy-1,4-benzoquinol methylase
MRHRRAAIRAWRSYRGAGAVTRAFLAARLAVLPLKPLAEEFARLRGRVLGVGSGHGIVARYLAELNRDVTVEGIDVDAARVAVATATEANAPRVRIHVADVRALAASDADAGAFDAVATVDLIHHLPPDDVALAAHAFARAVKPGGTLVIKDIARTPRWKHAVNRLHDRIVSGEATTAMDPLELADLLSEAGFEIERLDRVAPLSPYPHFILRARRLA